MASFEYIATTVDGQRTTGAIEASDAAGAHETLEAQGLVVIELRAVGTPSSPGLSAAEETEVVNHLRDLVTAEVPLSIGLRALAEELPSRRLRDAFIAMSADLETGQSVESAFASQSATLPSYLSGMAHAGVRAGNLGQSLSQFVEFLRMRDAFRKQMQLALAYPCVLLLVELLLLLGIFAFILPSFDAIFRGFGMALPTLTTSILAIGRFSQAAVVEWPITVVGIVLALWLLRWLARRLMESQTAVRFLYCVPVFGSALRYRSLAEFCRLLSMMLHNGVTLPVALRLSGDGVQEANLRDGAYHLAERVKSGTAADEAARRLPHFRTDFIHVLTSGRKDGQLAASLQDAAERFSVMSTVQVRVLGLGFEPLLIVGLGISVGLVVIALFMPLVTLLNALS